MQIPLWIEDALVKAIQIDTLGWRHKPKINHQTRDTLDGSHQNVTGIYTPNHNKASNWLVATLSISNLILCIGAGQYYLRFNSFIWSRIIHLKKKKNYSNFANKVSSTISNMRSIKSNIFSCERKSQSLSTERSEQKCTQMGGNRKTCPWEGKEGCGPVLFGCQSALEQASLIRQIVVQTGNYKARGFVVSWVGSFKLQ